MDPTLGDGKATATFIQSIVDSLCVSRKVGGPIDKATQVPAIFVHKSVAEVPGVDRHVGNAAQSKQSTYECIMCVCVYMCMYVRVYTHICMCVFWGAFFSLLSAFGKDDVRHNKDKDESRVPDSHPSPPRQHTPIVKGGNLLRLE